jgi:hypothetical protein
MLMAFLMFAKWRKFITKSKSITSLIFFSIFKFIFIRFIMISKINLKNFQISLKLKLFMYLMLELLELLLNFYSLGITFFLWDLWFQFFDFLLFFTFFLNLHYVFHFFPNKNCQVQKFETKKICRLRCARGTGGGGLWGNSTI